MAFLRKIEPLALLLLRWGLALVFIYHGYPKLFGGTSKFIESFRGVGLPGYLVYVAGTLEVFGGVALALGVFSSVAGLLLFLDMGVMLWKFDLHQGFYGVGDYELPLILGLAALVIAVTGGGSWSLDRLLFRRGRDSVMPRAWHRRGG
jgi:putative oxidoreductase